MDELWKDITSAGKVNIYTHRGPDGDSLGAVVGLKRMLAKHAPSSDIHAIVLDPLAGKLATCAISQETVSTDREADLYVYPDTPLDKMVTALHHPSIAIDHHATHIPFAQKQFIRLGPSLCGLFLRESQRMGIEVTASAAEAFLVGAVTDTGQGVYGDVTARAQALSDIAALDKICGKYQRSYVNTFWGMTLDQEKWLGRIYPQIQLDNGCMSLEVPSNESTGCSLSELRMMLQELTNRIPADHYIWGYSYKDSVRYSMRSETRDVNAFANRFGGAGHKGAAAFECKPTDTSPAGIIEQFRQYVSA
jgi:nanoRNase/pAp phosphatase (c-di-AMP/oligoRNAs hydrolase)